MSGSIWDWLTSPGSLGLGSPQQAAQSAAQGVGASDMMAAMNPALAAQASIANTAPQQAGNVASSVVPGWQQDLSGAGAGATPSSQTLVQALGKLSEQANKQNEQAKPPVNIGLRLSPYNTSSAGYNRGGGESLSSLIQALQQRYAGLMQPGASRSQGGLLG